MAAPTLQAQGNIAAVTTGNLAITLPTYAADDIVVITTVGWVPNTTSGTNTQSLASPWTKYSPDITTITSSLIDAEYAFWWARATSASSLGTTVTITRPTSWDTGTDTCWAGRAYVVRGCETSGDPYDQLVATAISTAANPAFPAVTVNAAERNVIVFMAKADNTATPTAATGYTVGTEASTTTGTDAAFQSYTDVTDTSVSAVTPTGGTSPAQGGSVYWGVSFKKPLVTISRTASDTGTGSESAAGARVGATITRTASDTGTGTESATGVFFSVFQRTASDTGTGSESAAGARVPVVYARTASDTGVGTEAAGGLKPDPRWELLTDFGFPFTGGHRFYLGAPIYPRTASDTGTGTESATFNIVPGTVVHQVTASASGTGTETASGTRLVARTASNTGTSSETASWATIPTRTGSATGTGTETANPNFFSILTRTASDSGTGTESASIAVICARSASAEGFGTSVAQGRLATSRTASASGAGSASTVSVKVLLRTTTNTGTGTGTAFGNRRFQKTATATGTGTETPATWVKSFIFRPPVNDQFAFVDRLDDSEDANLLSRLVRGGRAKNVFRLTDGTYTNIDPLDPALVDKIYLGGHNNMVSAEEKADLIAAGYTVT